MGQAPGPRPSAVSEARVVDRIPLPPGRTWAEWIASPRGPGEIFLEFHERAARALGLPVSAVRLNRQIWIPGRAGGGAMEGGWHVDACGRLGHVLAVVGDVPTEFLLGPWPAGFDPRSGDWAWPEREMRFWRPEPGELVHLTRDTIHRRPPEPVSHRLFLLASKIDG